MNQKINSRRLFIGKTKSTVKVGSWSTVKPPPGGPITVLFLPKSTRSSFPGACEKVLLEGQPNRILGFSEFRAPQKGSEDWCRTKTVEKYPILFLALLDNC